jgi:hypothetical protein
MDLIKESKAVPHLVNKINFKPKKPPKPINPEIAFKQNSWNLNLILLIVFVVFLIFFLYNCKYGFFKSVEDEPAPYSLVYNLT